MMDNIFKSWLSKKYTNLSIILIFSGLSVIYSLNIENKYMSITSVIVSSEIGDPRINGQISGLASLAGIEIGSGTNSKLNSILEIAKSRDFLVSFVEKNELKEELIAAIKWDKKDNKFIYDTEIYDETKDIWTRKPSGITKSEPSEEEVFEKIKEILKINYNKTNGVINISLMSLSPEKSKEWLELYIDNLTEKIRQKDIDEAKDSISYSLLAIDKESNNEVKKVFYNILEQNTTKLALAESRKNYLFEIIDKPFIPEKKVYPSRAIICIASFLMSIVLTFIISFLLYIAKSRN